MLSPGELGIHGAAHTRQVCFDAQGFIAEMSSPCVTYRSREPDNQDVVALETT